MACMELSAGVFALFPRSRMLMQIYPEEHRSAARYMANGKAGAGRATEVCTRAQRHGSEHQTRARACATRRTSCQNLILMAYGSRGRRPAGFQCIIRCIFDAQCVNACAICVSWWPGSRLAKYKYGVW